MNSTLSNIIDELGLTYDESVGLLDGDAVRTIPSVNVLNNLATLLNRFSTELDAVDEQDRKALDLLNATGDAEDDDDEHVAKRRRIDGGDDESNSPSTANSSADVKAEPVTPTKGSTNNAVVSTSSVVKSLQEAAKDLGLWNEPEPAHPDRAYYCRKYGVASYPTNDLQDYLPGQIPDTDFSKIKPPSNPVQLSTFQAYIESYFRPFCNTDIDFLEESNVIPPGIDADYDPDVTPYLIPKLGEHYNDSWDDEDAGKTSAGLPSHVRPLESYSAQGTVDNLVDENLYTEEVSCGPLSSRLLSAVLSTHEANARDIDDDEASIKPEDDIVATQLDSVEDYKVTANVSDYSSFEDRLRRELKYIGIFTNLPIIDEAASTKAGAIVKKPPHTNLVDHPEEWLMNREDDEVCGEMRKLQHELRAAVQRNRDHRKRLVSIIEEQLAYQEYQTILEDLDKQVDQAYMKRLKQKNKKKKSTSTTAQKTTPESQQQLHQQLQQQQAANSGLRALLDKRQRWINNIGKLFPPPEVMKRVPKESILGTEGDDNDGDGDEVTTTTDLIRQAE
ncbi:hypothetical protein DIURU_004455 [Diutina rugosa]|uniref:Uncharacterized protein n=1 Tax=Diutina rugosa TaxID=5481 RepID=A0A642UHF7_DIURU|nr:uncharacterized protein DIURU_004455 [Diutina rugosa]KAA8899074.1 hypothetical protein DIURU_004455 [Diutina rugosa]